LYIEGTWRPYRSFKKNTSNGRLGEKRLLATKSGSTGGGETEPQLELHRPLTKEC